MTKKYDVIIVGAGIGGLHAGIYLQSENPGLKTLIVEQNDYPGGYVSGFTINGFYFDSAAETILGYAKSSSRAILQKYDFYHPIHAIEPMEAYYNDNHIVRMFSNPELFLQDIEKVHPDQSAGVRKLIETSHQIRKDIKELSLDKGITFGKLLRIIFKRPVLRKYARKNYKQLLDEFITNDEVKDYFKLFSLWFGLKLENLKAPILAYIISVAFTEGLYYPEGGMGAFAKKLAELYIARGGELRYKNTVKKILIEKRTAKGVLLTSGEEIHADYIIANSDLHKTIFEYIGKKHFSRRFTDRIRKIETSMSGVLLYLGIENYDLSKYPAHLMIGRTSDITKNYEENDFNVDGIAVRIPNNSDKLKARPEKESLIVLTFAPYNWNNFWKIGRNKKRTKEYRELKKSIIAKIIAKLESFMPNISKHIKIKRLATPMTFERFNGSTNGAWYGPKVNQRLPSFKSQIKNLFFAGSNVGGSGVQAAMSSGLETGAFLMRKMNKKLLKEY